MDDDKKYSLSQLRGAFFAGSMDEPAKRKRHATDEDCPIVRRRKGPEESRPTDLEVAEYLVTLLKERDTIDPALQSKWSTKDDPAVDRLHRINAAIIMLVGDLATVFAPRYIVMGELRPIPFGHERRRGDTSKPHSRRERRRHN